MEGQRGCGENRGVRWPSSTCRRMLAAFHLKIRTHMCCRNASGHLHKTHIMWGDNVQLHKGYCSLSAYVAGNKAQAFPMSPGEALKELNRKLEERQKTALCWSETPNDTVLLIRWPNRSESACAGQRGFRVLGALVKLNSCTTVNSFHLNWDLKEMLPSCSRCTLLYRMVTLAAARS